MSKQFHSPEKIQLEKRTLADEGGRIIDRAFRQKRGLQLSERRQLQSINRQIANLDSHLPKPDTRMAGQEDFGRDPEKRSADSSPEMLAYRTWIRGGVAAMSPAQRRDFDDRMVKLDDDGQTELRALLAGTPSSGGYTVPTEIWPEVEIALKSYSGLLNAAEVTTTDDGAPLRIGTVNDLSNGGEILAEGDSASGDSVDVDPSFGAVTLGGFMFSSGIFKVTLQLLQDTAVDIEGMIRQLAIDRIGRKLAAALITGAGTTEPRGLALDAQTGPTSSTGTPTTFTYTDLLNLQHEIDPAFRQLPGAGWLMSDAALKICKGLADDQHRPLFVGNGSGDISQPSPGKLLGDPITIDQQVAVPAASAKSIFYGCLKKYRVRIVKQLTIIRFSERYMHQLKVGFLGVLRADAALIDASAGTRPPVKYLLQSAS